MPAVLIAARPSPWQRRARTTGRYALALAVAVLHLAVASIVLPLRITHVILGMAATQAAYTELYLASKTGRQPLGQAAGVALTTAFAHEFRTAYHANTR